jgi:hypothetical protein
MHNENRMATQVALISQEELMALTSKLFYTSGDNTISISFFFRVLWAVGNSEELKNIDTFNAVVCIGF